MIFEPLLEKLQIQQKLQACCRHLASEYYYRFARIVRLLIIHVLSDFLALRDIDFYRENPLVQRV